MGAGLLPQPAGGTGLSRRLGVSAALRAEAGCLYAGRLAIATPVEIEKDLFLCLSGTGQRAAARSAARLRGTGIRALVSWGVAGAIERGLGPGEVLVASRIAGDGINHDPPADWRDRVLHRLRRQGHHARAAPLASIDRICRGPAQKRALAAATGAGAVDMESAALAAAAQNHKLDLLVLRAIADTLDDPLPAAVTEHTDSLGRPRLPGFLVSVLKQPGQIAALITLSSRYRKALGALTTIAADFSARHFLYDTDREP